MTTIREDFDQARKILEKFLKDDSNMTAVGACAEIMVDALRKGHKLISCGNGGSMCDAMHFAEELSGFFRDKRRPVAALAISDPSHITCTANDIGFEHVFSRYVEAVGQPGDVLLAISTSGNSVNVVNAAMAAREKGMKVIGLTGNDGGRLAPLCDAEVRAPFSLFSDRTQEIHIKVIHSLIHYIEVALSVADHGTKP